MTKTLDVHRAARYADIDAVRAYLREGGDPRRMDRYECEPIYYAVKHDNLEIAQLLLEAGGDIQHHSNFRGDAIGAAVWNLNLRMVEFLLSSNVNINRLVRGKTPLDLVDELRSYCGDRLPEVDDVTQRLIQHGAKKACDLA